MTATAIIYAVPLASIGLLLWATWRGTRLPGGQRKEWK